MTAAPARPKPPVTVALGPHRDPRFAIGVAHFARQAGWILNVLPWRVGHIESGYLGQARGIIGVFSRGHGPDFSAARASGLPLVSMGAPPDPGIPSVGPDYHAIARLGVEHLLERGFRRILLALDDVAGVGGAFLAAARAAVAGHAGTSLEFLVVPPGIDWLLDLQKARRPTAILAVSDFMGAILLQQCRGAGIVVPDQIAVVGAGNEEVLCLADTVRLTSVDPDHKRVGFEAARLMHRLLQGRKPPRRPILIPPRGVVVRDSSDHLVVEHPHALRALAYVREHFREPITPAGVARAAGISRVYLDLLLRRSLGRSLMAEIVRRRLAAAGELLSQTDVKCSAVAALSGLSSALTLHRTFKRHFDCTPQQYRNRFRKT